MAPFAHRPPLPASPLLLGGQRHKLVSGDGDETGDGDGTDDMVYWFSFICIVTLLSGSRRYYVGLHAPNLLIIC